MIRPIFETPSPEKTPPSPKNQPKEPVVSIPPNITRAPKSTSLKNILVKEPETVHQPAGGESAKLATPFNTDDLIRCWDAYADTLEEKAHLKSTMIHCKPVLSDGFKFSVMVSNPAQQEELISNSIELLKIMRTQLKNEHIQLHIRIDETTEKNKPIYTSSEKYEFLNELNPLLSKLKDTFDLIID